MTQPSSHFLQFPPSARPSDAPLTQASVTDSLGHDQVAKHAAATLRTCHPPYVLGVLGDWGSANTSTLHNLSLDLVGERLDDPDALVVWFENSDRTSS